MVDFAENGRGEPSSDLGRRLRELQHRVPRSEIGELWVFPPLAEPEGTREFVLFTRFAGNGSRRLYSARIPPDGENGSGPWRGFEPPTGGGAADGNGDGRQEVTEHGRVPAGRVPRLVEQLLRRLDEDREPLHVNVDGRQERWSELLGRFGAAADGDEDGSGANGAGPGGAGRDGEAEIDASGRDR